MTDDRDPLELLRAAWRAERTVPTESLDAETRATVRYLRDAFAAQAPVPPAALLRRLERRARRRPLQLVRYGSALAAAAALVMWLHLGRGPQPGVVEPSPQPGAPPTVAPPTSTSGEGVIWRASTGDYHPRDDGLELRSGSVRLILLTTPTPLGKPESDATSF